MKNLLFTLLLFVSLGVLANNQIVINGINYIFTSEDAKGLYKDLKDSVNVEKLVDMGVLAIGPLCQFSSTTLSQQEIDSIIKSESESYKQAVIAGDTNRANRYRERLINDYHCNEAFVEQALREAPQFPDNSAAYAIEISAIVAELLQNGIAAEQILVGFDIDETLVHKLGSYSLMSQDKFEEAHAIKPSLAPGAQELLNWLAGNGIRIIAITTGQKSEDKLVDLGVRAKFRDVLTTRVVPREDDPSKTRTITKGEILIEYLHSTGDHFSNIIFADDIDENLHSMGENLAGTNIEFTPILVEDVSQM